MEGTDTESCLAFTLCNVSAGSEMTDMCSYVTNKDRTWLLKKIAKEQLIFILEL